MNRISLALLALSLTFGAVACKSEPEQKTEAKTEEAKTEAKTEEPKTEEKKTEPKGPQPTRVD